MKILRVTLFSFTLFWTQTFQPIFAKTKTTEDGKTFVTDEEDLQKQYMMSNLLLLGVAGAAVPMITWCRSKKSAWIYFGAATLYVANEIGLFNKFKEGSEKEMAVYEGQDKDKQMESVNSAAKQTDEAAKAAEQKAQFASYAAMGFGLASALAFMEAMEVWGMQGACTGNVEKQFEPRSPLNPFNPRSIAYIENAVQKNEDIAFLYEETDRLQNGHLQSQSLSDYNNFNETLQKDNDIAHYFNKVGHLFLNNIFPKANAMIGGGGGAGGNKLAYLIGGAGAGFVVTKMIGASAKDFLSSGYTRGALFGGFALLAFKAQSDMKKAANTLKKRAGQYRELYIDMKQKGVTNLANGSKISSLNKVYIDDPLGVKLDSSSSSNPTGCITGARGQAYSDPSCTCTETNTCKAPDIPNLSKMDSTFNTGGLLAEGANALGDASNSLYSGGTESLGLNDGQVSNLAARINKLKSKAQSKINEKLKALGKKPVDNWANYEKSKFDNYMDDVRDKMNNLSANQQNEILSQVPELGESSLIDDAIDSDKNKLALASTGNGLKDLGMAKGSGARLNNNKFNDLDFNFDEKKPAAVDEISLNDDELANLPVDDGSDINDNRHGDLFKIITGRYQKTAYPVFFDLLGR